MLKKLKPMFKNLLAVASFTLVLVICLCWWAVTISKNADNRREYKILNDVYSQPLKIDETGYTQRFNWDAGETLYGMRLYVSTGGAAQGQLQLELFDHDDNHLAFASADVAEFPDGGFYGFVWDVPFESSEIAKLYFTVKTRDVPADAKVSLWGSEKSQGVKLYRGIGRSGEKLNATFAMQGMKDYSGFSVGKMAKWIALLCGITLFAAVILLLQKKSIAAVFICVAFGLGVCQSLILPPLSGPDEYAHAAGAYAQTSKLMGMDPYDEEGHLLMRKGDSGAMYDESAPGDAFALAHAYEELGGGGIKGELSAIKTVRSPASPVPYLYLPAVMGMLAARFIGLNFYTLLLMARLCGLGVYIVLGAWALKRMPFGKAALFTSLLLPSTLGIAASISADNVLIGMCFAYVALCLSLSFGENKATVYDRIALPVLAALLGPAKAVYVLLIPLVLLIPANRFAKKKDWQANRFVTIAAAFVGWCLFNLEYILYIMRDINSAAMLSMLAAVAAVAMVLPRLYHWWKQLPTKIRNGSLVFFGFVVCAAAVVGLHALHVSPGYTPEQLAEGIQPNGDSIYTYSVGYCLRNIPQVVLLLASSLLSQGALILQQAVGAWPGEPIVYKLQLNELLTLAIFAQLALCALRTEKEKKRLTKKSRAAAALICIGVMGLITAACLTWTPINYDHVFGLQGRYLLPLLPMLLLIWGDNGLICLKKDHSRAICMSACVLNALAMMNTFVLFTAR